MERISSIQKEHILSLMLKEADKEHFILLDFMTVNGLYFNLFETVVSITLRLKINKKCCHIYQNVLKETQQFC